MILLTDRRADWDDILASSRRFDREGAGIYSFPIVDTFEGEINDPQSLHKYLYCHDDPVNGIDPTGLLLVSGLSGLGLRIGLAVALVRGPLAFYKSFSETRDMRTAALAGCSNGLFGFLEGYYYGAGKIGALAGVAVTDLLVQLFLVYRGGTYGLPVDPSPPNPNPEWTPNSFLNHIDSMPLPAGATESDRLIAKAAIHDLWQQHSRGQELLSPEAAVPGEACHMFCLAVLGNWNGKYQTSTYAETTARAKFFRVFRTEYERQDGLVVRQYSIY